MKVGNAMSWAACNSFTLAGPRARCSITLLRVEEESAEKKRFKSFGMGGICTWIVWKVNSVSELAKCFSPFNARARRVAFGYV